MNRILIVGGAGYLGSAVLGWSHTRPLLYQSIVVADNLCYVDEFNYQDNKVSFYFCDIRTDLENLEKIIIGHNITTIIWLAAIVGDAACQRNEKLAWEVNYFSLKSFLARTKFKGHFIFASTCSIYGFSNDPITKESKPNPLSVYADSKLQAETVVRQFYESRKCPTTILRFGTLCGIPRFLGRMRFDLVVNLFVAKAAAGESAEIRGADNLRPFLEVNDAAYLISRVVERRKAGIEEINAFAEHKSILQVAQIVDDVSVKSFYYELVPDEVDDNRNYLIAGEPPTDFACSVRNAARYMMTQLTQGRFKNYRSPKYAN